MAVLNRNELAWYEKHRRCLYLFLRDELEALLIHEGLIRSYHTFKEKGKEYPFVEMRELKPRSRTVGPEHPEQQHFILIFNEGTLPPEAKNYIRFFDSNKVTKENLGNMALFDLAEGFSQRMRYCGDSEFPSLVKGLLGLDFALLVQGDPTVRAKFKFGVSHFHVRIDWPVAEASADLARQLRYISKDLYEKGDKAGETLQQKLYEYYGFHHTVGGRRTAGLVAARFLSRYDFMSTIYVSSSESRTLFKIAEHNIGKYVLIRIPREDMEDMAEALSMPFDDFCGAYLIDRTAEYGVGIFLVTYNHNEHSLAPMDGKLRDFQADYQWLKVDLQLLVPPPCNSEVRPIPYSRVYSGPS
ncbi:MAG: hypothetical protein AB1646_23965 [Thermodesulfobacteriota bacterium]